MSATLRLRAGKLNWRIIDDEVVLLDGAESTYLATNAAGTLLWRALSDGATREELVARLVAEYGIGDARAGADTDSFLDVLRDRDLLDER